MNCSKKEFFVCNNRIIIIIEFGNKQFFVPDRITNSILDKIDHINSISTNQLKFCYNGIENGCHILDIFYTHAAQYSHMAEYGAV